MALVSLSTQRASGTRIQSSGRHTGQGESRHMDKQETDRMVGWERGSYGPGHTEPKSRGWQTGHDSQDTESSSMESHLEEPYI